jgi:hypothetical protein
MFHPARIWRFFVPVLLIVLLLAATMGMVCHHHDHRSADGCMLCHLAIAPGAPGSKACELRTELAEYSIHEEAFVSRCAADEKPPRAPPV